GSRGLADGGLMATTSKKVDFDTVWNAHPKIAEDELEPCKGPDGNSPYANQCAIRLGIALKAAGVVVPKKTKGKAGGVAQCWMKGHGDAQHCLRAEELAN